MPQVPHFRICAQFFVLAPQECNVHFGSLFSDAMGMCAPLWTLRQCWSIPVHGQRVMLFMGIAHFFFIASIPFVCIDPELATDHLWLCEDLSLDDVLTSFLSLLVGADVVCVAVVCCSCNICIFFILSGQCIAGSIQASSIALQKLQ